MPNQNASALSGILTQVGTAGAASIGLAGIGRLSSVISRENLVNALMPKFAAGAINGLLDGVGRKEEPKATAKPSISQTESIKADQEDEDDYGDLLEVMEDGFEETTQALAMIIDRLGGPEEDVSLVDGVEQTVAIIDDGVDQDHQDMVELLSLNGVMLKTLEKIEMNTRVDQLAAREAEIEARKSNLILPVSLANTIGKEEQTKDKKDGVLSKLFDNFGDLALGYLGLKGATKGLGKATGVAGALAGTKALAPKSTPKLAVTAVKPSVGPLVADKADDVAKGVAKAIPKTGILSGIKSVGGRLLGAPLAVATGAYEAVQTANNDNLTTEQKTTEYSKIGGKTAGAIAGAKAGAVVGAVGGPIGAAVGGILGGIGGFFLGEKGGEVIGNLINTIMPSTEAKDVSISQKEDINVESIKNVKAQEVKTSLSSVDVAKVAAPQIEPIQAGQTRTTQLQVLTQQIDQVRNEVEDMKASPIIAPISINNVNNNTTTQTPQQTRMNIPAVRNQDGTIQRLLDANYKPLMV